MQTRGKKKAKRTNRITTRGQKEGEEKGKKKVNKKRTRRKSEEDNTNKEEEEKKKKLVGSDYDGPKFFQSPYRRMRKWQKEIYKLT